MKKRYNSLLIAAIAILTILFAGCQEEYEHIESSGNLRIQLTDAPFPTDLVAEANVTIGKIEIRTKSDTANPYIILSEEEEIFNLLDLTNGVTAILADTVLESGYYDLIRLYVSEASIKLMDDETEYSLKIPSGEQTGIKIKINPPVAIGGEETTELLLDFDVNRSFLLKGNIKTPAGIKGFNFKPVVKVSNLSAAGKLEGMVKDTLDVPIDGAQVSVIAADTVYASSFTGGNGKYEILGIDGGTYDVEFAKEGFIEQLVESIEIVEGTSTTLDAVLVPVEETNGD